VIEQLLKDRYLLPGEESWGDICYRVSRFLFPDDEIKADRLEQLMGEKKFIFSSPTLMNAGTETPMLSSCFALGMEDSLDSITDTMARAAKIFKLGGGVGIDFSSLRPKGAKIGTTGGVSDGVISFMELFNQYTDTVKQGAKRRGAAISTLDVSHPDIVDFIKCKTTEGNLSNMNISVRITDEFMFAVRNAKEWTMEFGDIKKSMPALELWNLICESAWKYGEPGVIFIDTIKQFDKFHPETVNYKYGQNPSLLPTTKVLTKNGIFEIKDLCNKEFYVPSNSGFSKARCILSGKNKQVMEVKLDGNITYYATPEHHWTTIGHGKLTTSELKSGMCLPTKKWNYSFGDIGTYDEGFLIGWNYGDGSITQRADNGKHQYGFVFGESDIKNGIYDKIRDILTSITGEKYNPTARNRGKQDWVEISIINHKIDNLFKEYGFFGKLHGLPDLMFTDMSDSFNRGFIDGLFSADASIHNSSKYKSGEKFTFASSQEKLAYDVNELLGFYGIQTSINKGVITDVSFPNEKNYEREYTVYRVNIKDIYRFRNIFTLTHVDKDKFINSMVRKKVYDKIKIESITNTDIVSDVYDLQVYDGDHEFTLSHCQTHNCSEAILLTCPGGGESCNLGSINIFKYESDIELEKDIHLIVDALNRVIDKNMYPNPEIEFMTKKFRRIGLGVMGVHDWLIKKEVKYGTWYGNQLITDLCKFITDAARYRSKELQYDNLSVTAIAPTGTISMIAGCSSGIEPNYSYVYDRNIWENNVPRKYRVINPLFEEHLDNNYNALMKDKIINHMLYNGTIQDCDLATDETKHLFITAKDLTYTEHINALESAQQYTDMSVSKTINLPNSATVDIISKIYNKCYDSGIKGVTIYRDGSREIEVLSSAKIEKKSNEFILPEPRIRKIRAYHYLKDSGCGELEITVTFNDDNRVTDVFVNTSGGGCDANINAIARHISCELRCNVDPYHVISQAKKVVCKLAMEKYKANMCEGKSCSWIIGDCIEDVLKTITENKVEIIEQKITMDKCPNCQSDLQFVEGCRKCMNCGWSKC